MDGSNNNVATYRYDPYGKVITATGTLADINPLRYRGYYYDTETGFYYLQSRYYDPAICRFINADSYVSTGQGLLGCNMFAYCKNNPVRYADKSGNYPGDGSDPLEDLLPLIFEWFRETDENEKDKNGKPTSAAKIKKTTKAIFSHFEFSAGIGLGVYGNLDVLGMGVDAGLYETLLTVQYSDGIISVGREEYAGITTEILFQEVGFSESIYMNSEGVKQINKWYYINGEQTNITLFSFSAYLLGGGSVYIGYNMVGLYDDLEEIWR